MIDYTGCGCGGEQTVTIKGEHIKEKDWNGTVTDDKGRRTRKLFQDFLGRTHKTEFYEWENQSSIYLTNTAVFNGRDQEVSVTKTDANSVSQVGTRQYDGYGRLTHAKLPQQSSSSSRTYNAIDQVVTSTDARGVVKTMTYNSRGLPTLYSFSVPDDPNNPGNPDPAIRDSGDILFEYDNVGNRKKMTDPLGTVTYKYNELSRLTEETRDFTGSNDPTGVFTLKYTYTRGGAVKSLEDPFSDKINYTFNKSGRLTKVEGNTSYGSNTAISTYAEQFHYRAWGSAQSMRYGNGIDRKITGYNDLQRATGFELERVSNSEILMDKTYEYYSDQKLRKVDDNVSYSQNSDVFDRLITYDHQGRAKEGKSGPEAHGQTVNSADMSFQLPFRQTYDFNAFGNLTNRTNLHWGEGDINGNGFDYTRTYTNDRVSGWSHDDDGRVRNDGSRTYRYDSHGRLSHQFKTDDIDNESFFDGNKRFAKQINKSYSVDENGNGSWETETFYLIRSSLLGGAVISELDADGDKKKTFVYGGGTRLATQLLTGSNETVRFLHQDALGISRRATLDNGIFLEFGDEDGSAAEFDPLGNNVGVFSPYLFSNIPPDPPEFPGQEAPQTGQYTANNPFNVSYTLDGQDVEAHVAQAALASGAAEVLPGGDEGGLTSGGFWIYTENSRPGGEETCSSGNCQGDDGTWTVEVPAATYSRSWVPSSGGGGGGGIQVEEPPQIDGVDKAQRICFNAIWGQGGRRQATLVQTDVKAKAGSRDGKVEVSVSNTSNGRLTIRTFEQDATSRTGAQLANQFKKDNPRRKNQARSFLQGYAIGGKAWIATDIHKGETYTTLGKRIGDTRATQVHELGNQLATIYDSAPSEFDAIRNKYSDTDDGIVFEHCVNEVLRGRRFP